MAVFIHHQNLQKLAVIPNFNPCISCDLFKFSSIVFPPGILINTLKNGNEYETGFTVMPFRHNSACFIQSG